MVGPDRLRHLLLAGKQELDLRSQSRTGRPNGGSPDTTNGQPTNNYTNFINASALPVKYRHRPDLGREPEPADHLHMQYVLNVQRALGKSTTLEVGYNGSQSRTRGQPDE